MVFITYLHGGDALVQAIELVVEKELQALTSSRPSRLIKCSLCSHPVTMEHILLIQKKTIIFMCDFISWIKLITGTRVDSMASSSTGHYNIFTGEYGPPPADQVVYTNSWKVFVWFVWSWSDRIWSDWFDRFDLNCCWSDSIDLTWSILFDLIDSFGYSIIFHS